MIHVYLHKNIYYHKNYKRLIWVSKHQEKRIDDKRFDYQVIIRSHPEEQYGDVTWRNSFEVDNLVDLISTQELIFYILTVLAFNHMFFLMIGIT